MIRIWGRQNSGNVKRVLWCAEEIGLAYERIDAGGAFGLLDTPEFRALNPNGMIPVVEDEGLVLWESCAIVRYLTARYSHGVLYAADPGARALADRWMDWPHNVFIPAYIIFFVGLVRTPPEKRDMAAIEAAAARGADALRILDEALARQPYLSGQAFGMGDIPMGVQIHGWFNLPMERPALPHLRAWYDRLLERPAYREFVATPLT